MIIPKLSLVVNDPDLGVNLLCGFTQVLRVLLLLWDFACGAAISAAFSTSAVPVPGLAGCHLSKSVRGDVWYLFVRARFWSRKVKKKKNEKSQKVKK